MPRILLLLLVACSPSSSPTRPTPPSPPAPVTAPEPTDVAEDDPDQECGRYHELFARLDACTQLSDEDRNRIAQRDTDMVAARSESGMDGSSPYDTEAGCEEGTAFILRVAATPCGW